MTDNRLWWIIGLLVVVEVTMLLIKFPIKIEFITTNCPKTVCESALVVCNCNCLNGTLQEEKSPWGYYNPAFNLTQPIPYWENGRIYQVNYSYDSFCTGRSVCV